MQTITSTRTETDDYHLACFGAKTLKRTIMHQTVTDVLIVCITHHHGNDNKSSQKISFVESPKAGNPPKRHEARSIPLAPAQKICFADLNATKKLIIIIIK